MSACVCIYRIEKCSSNTNHLVILATCLNNVKVLMIKQYVLYNFKVYSS